MASQGYYHQGPPPPGPPPPGGGYEQGYPPQQGYGYPPQQGGYPPQGPPPMQYQQPRPEEKSKSGGQGCLGACEVYNQAWPPFAAASSARKAASAAPTALSAARCAKLPDPRPQ
ncbi:hypothetical protein N7526_010980 [Penicillium atrosanguineum]|nr:hypothetical protein N7526_010980 [Penicillium atrosanguineum]